MIKLVLAEIIAAIEGRVGSSTAPPLSVGGVSTDSRTVQSGELFFALAGPTFDGHAFLTDAFRRGAVGAVIDAEKAASAATALRAAGLSGLLIEVKDPLAAMGRLATFHRRQSSADVIAVVGSNGKTTTKAMIDHVLQAKHKGRSSPKSFNNEIGVPLTLLSAEAADDYLVVEIGTNSPGEIARLAALAKPEMAVITCICEEHLQGLRDLDGVAKEECSVLDHLERGGFAAVNADWSGIRDYLPDHGLKIATFGRNKSADLRVTESRYRDPWLCFTVNDRFSYRLRMPGMHNALNAAAAITIALRWGMTHEEIAARLETFSALPMRSELLRIGGVTIINDAYNANPESALAAIDALEAMPVTGRRIVVFGEMLELGERAPELHRRVAERLRDGEIHHVLLVGPAAEMMASVLRREDTLFGPRVECLQSVDDCRAALLALVKDGDAILLKASRRVALDRLVDPLRSALGGGDRTAVG